MYAESSNDDYKGYAQIATQRDFDAFQQNLCIPKLCSNCGAIHKHLTLADRTYVCPSCGFTIDRDINAAINLREKMKKTLVGGVTAEFMRVDPHRLNEDLAINQVKTMAYEARIQ